MATPPRFAKPSDRFAATRDREGPRVALASEPRHRIAERGDV